MITNFASSTPWRKQQWSTTNNNPRIPSRTGQRRRFIHSSPACFCEEFPTGRVYHRGSVFKVQFQHQNHACLSISTQQQQQQQRLEHLSLQSGECCGYNRTLYAITDTYQIGVLSLNHQDIKLVSLKSGDDDGDQVLLVVCFITPQVLEVYKIYLHDDIDNNINNGWVKHEMLQNCALFYSSKAWYCTSLTLRDPQQLQWGFENGRVYGIDTDSVNLKVSSVFFGQHVDTIVVRELPPPNNNDHAEWYNAHWYFPHLRHEIRYEIWKPWSGDTMRFNLQLPIISNSDFAFKVAAAMLCFFKPSHQCDFSFLWQKF